jgi:hypothetical protein
MGAHTSFSALRIVQINGFPIFQKMHFWPFLVFLLQLVYLFLTKLTLLPLYKLCKEARESVKLLL